MTLSWWPFRQKQPNGLIKCYGLADWWMNELSGAERACIQNTYKPLGETPGSLTAGEISYSSQHVVGFLSCLASWFNKSDTRTIAYKILAKGQCLVSAAPVLDQHFFWHQAIEINYRERENPLHLDAAIQACRNQIALAPQAGTAFRAKYRGRALPSHKGYEQLSIILGKAGQYHEAIDLCRTARDQGWAGGWESRIERCTRSARKS